MSTYFVQECPTCGRTLQVSVEYLGRQVVCQHCHGRFEACDPASTPHRHLSDSGIDLLRRADRLLESAGDQDSYGLK
ncbi:MAG: response regulator [Pirellulales bacterium]